MWVGPPSSNYAWPHPGTVNRNTLY